MKRYLLSIIFGILTMANISYGQVEVSFVSNTANANGTVDIDVTTSGFSNISVLQFSAGWDSLVMTFNSITFTNPGLADLMPSSFGSPMGSIAVNEGQFTLSYGNPTGEGNLPDGSVLFTVRFDIVGDECDETALDFTDTPTPIDAYDNNFNQLTITPNSGTMMINGPDCGGGGGDEITFTAGIVNGDLGTNICVPITVTNFIDIQQGSGVILWDPTVLSYTGIANEALGGLSGTLNELEVANGELKFIWSNLDPENPLTLADGTIAFEICFDVIGSVGEMTTITLSEEGNLGFAWGTDDIEELPQILTNGKVTVTETVGDPVTFSVSDITVNEDDTNQCVNITVDNFNDVLGFQYVITWDASIISNVTPSNFNLDGLNAGSFNIEGDCATLSWNALAGSNVADGTQIFSMCFDVIGDCVSTSIVDLITKGQILLEVFDSNTDALPVQINEGTITVECEGDPCDIVSIDNTCSGVAGGNVIVDVPTEDCTFSWANGSGTQVATTKNLLGVVAGTYILTVTCGGVEYCMITATVDNFVDLTITDEVTNAGCGDLGAIDVTVSLGSGNYSYNWNPAQDNSPSISDLEPGMYQLTVTDDDTNCTKTAQYNVLDVVADLAITSAPTVDETCGAGNGRISLTVDGGCAPYSFAWSDSEIGNTPIAMNLSAGVYAVIVTDSSTPAKIVMASYTLDGSTLMMLAGTPVVVPTMGMDGSITIEITGGAPNYNYSWSGPTTGLPNSNIITGLLPGMYSVTVTDSDGCQQTFGPFELIQITITDEPEIMGVQAENNNNGFAVMCNGDTNGKIVGSIIGGNLPMTIELSGGESRTINIDGYGTFTIDSLAAGTYSVTVSNSDGSKSVDNIMVLEPDALTSAIETGCDSEEQCDGFIDVNVSGGFGTYSYDWGNSDLNGGSLNDLCQGAYAVLVTDENGCELMESIDIESCEGPVKPGCYEVRDVITPNGDGMNDQFTVTCINDFPSNLEIYDRWGKLVFNQDSYDGTWMGVSNSNEELSEGGYMYLINIDFGQGRREIMKGTITLLRD